MNNRDRDIEMLAAAGCPYEIGMLLGEGGMARVYLGTHRGTGRQAAIKIPIGGPWAHERFRAEVDVMDRFDHIHVMPLLEADPARRWYAMPWALHSLHDLHRANPAAWDALRKALSSVAGALMHTHARDCIHRDVSPDNILQLRNGHWVLADFGIAKVPGVARRGTRLGERFGAEGFTAPELPHEATPATDSYVIGAVASWFTAIRPGQRPTSRAGIEWLELIEGTLRHDPSSRWTIAEIASQLDRMDLEPAPVFAGGHRLDSCLRCGASDGVDAAERCVRCGYMAEG
jgi:serine/threonine protein kinase